MLGNPHVIRTDATDDGNEEAKGEKTDYRTLLSTFHSQAHDDGDGKKCDKELR